MAEITRAGSRMGRIIDAMHMSGEIETEEGVHIYVPLDCDSARCGVRGRPQLRVVMCRARLGLKARAWAGLGWAWASQNSSPALS